MKLTIRFVFFLILAVFLTACGNVNGSKTFEPEHLTYSIEPKEGDDMIHYVGSLKEVKNAAPFEFKVPKHEKLKPAPEITVQQHKDIDVDGENGIFILADFFDGTGTIILTVANYQIFEEEGVDETEHGFTKRWSDGGINYDINVVDIDYITPDNLLDYMK